MCAYQGLDIKGVEKLTKEIHNNAAREFMIAPRPVHETGQHRIMQIHSGVLRYLC